MSESKLYVISRQTCQSLTGFVNYYVKYLTLQNENLLSIFTALVTAYSVFLLGSLVRQYDVKTNCYIVSAKQMENKID